MKLTTEEKRRLRSALSYAVAAAPTAQLRWEYGCLDKKLKDALRNEGAHLTLVEPDPPDEAA